MEFKVIMGKIKIYGILKKGEVIADWVKTDSDFETTKKYVKGEMSKAEKDEFEKKYYFEYTTQPRKKNKPRYKDYDDYRIDKIYEESYKDYDKFSF